MYTAGSPAASSGGGVFYERGLHPEHALLVGRHLLTTATAEPLADLFAMLNDPTRLQVVYALVRLPTGEVCVRDLAGLGRDNTTISHHLRVLRTHHIVALHKVGRVASYRLVDERICHLLAVGLTRANEPLPAEFSREMEGSL